MVESPARDGLQVLHLTSERGWGGGEHQLGLLTEALARRGVSQSVAAPSDAGLFAKAEAAAARRVDLRPRPFLDPRNVLRLVLWLRRHPQTLIHAHSSPALSLAAVARSAAAVAGIVFTRHVGYPVRRSWKYRSAADRYVAVSEAVASRLAGAGLDRGRLQVIPPAIDLTGFPDPETLRQVAVEDREPRVVAVGRLAPEKGGRVLIEAWTRVAEATPGATLTLVGEGPERSALQLAANGVRNRSVHLVGFQSDVTGCLYGSDLFVQPSVAEGLPVAVLEAMACALPVVATAVGGIGEAVDDGRTGLLVPPGDPGSLADAILGLLGDPGRARELGRAGRRRVARRFDAPRMVEAYLELYGSFFSNPSPE